MTYCPIQMLKRNMSIKLAPQRWQDNQDLFDVVIVFEERLMDNLLEGEQLNAMQAALCKVSRELLGDGSQCISVRSAPSQHLQQVLCLAWTFSMLACTRLMEMQDSRELMSSLGCRLQQQSAEQSQAATCDQHCESLCHASPSDSESHACIVCCLGSQSMRVRARYQHSSAYVTCK